MFLEDGFFHPFGPVSTGQAQTFCTQTFCSNTALLSTLTRGPFPESVPGKELSPEPGSPHATAPFLAAPGTFSRVLEGDLQFGARASLLSRTRGLVSGILAVPDPPFLQAGGGGAPAGALRPGAGGELRGGGSRARPDRPQPAAAARRPTLGDGECSGPATVRFFPVNSAPGASLTYGRTLLLVRWLTSRGRQRRGAATFSHPRAGRRALEAGWGPAAARDPAQRCVPAGDRRPGVKPGRGPQSRDLK